MSSSPAMDWTAKWDWENLVMYNPNAIESPKKQPTDWGLEEEGDIDEGSFNLSGVGAGSGSDLGHGSSVKSSISVSTDASSKDGIKASKISLEAFHDFPADFSGKKQLARTELTETSPSLEPSVASAEPLIGLRLGKRTYFENNSMSGNTKNSSVQVSHVSSSITAKKIKSSCQNMPPRCQVEGCNLDLSSAKDYHRKHRVCENHSKSPKVVVGSLECRFCQQCSRFHSLSEFDEKKRSCRRRLSDHNARRRKPHQDAIQFNSTRLSPPFLNGSQQISFVLNNGPLLHGRSSENLLWESTCNSKFTLTKGFRLKSEKTGDIDERRTWEGGALPPANSMHGQNANKLLQCKGNKSEVLTQGLKEPMFSSNVDTAPDLDRALSLLSTNSWSPKSANITIDHPTHVGPICVPQVAMHDLAEGLPLPSSEHWQPAQMANFRAHNMTANDGSHFQEMQLFKPAYESGLYSYILN